MNCKNMYSQNFFGSLLQALTNSFLVVRNESADSVEIIVTRKCFAPAIPLDRWKKRLKKGVIYKEKRDGKLAIFFCSLLNGYELA